MGFLEPEGRAECDECGEEVEVNLVQLATVIHSSWMYEPEQLPGGWLHHRGDIWCPEHAEEAARDLGLVEDQNEEDDWFSRSSVFDYINSQLANGWVCAAVSSNDTAPATMYSISLMSPGEVETGFRKRFSAPTPENALKLAIEFSESITWQEYANQLSKDMQQLYDDERDIQE